MLAAIIAVVVVLVLMYLVFGPDVFVNFFLCVLDCLPDMSDGD